MCVWQSKERGRERSLGLEAQVSLNNYMVDTSYPYITVVAYGPGGTTQLARHGVSTPFVDVDGLLADSSYSDAVPTCRIGLFDPNIPHPIKKQISSSAGPQ